ncbi:hypothetical protein ABIA30_001944 [Mycobacterium sp. MAA66]|uniref:hypothetical protein n=1 Tax=Mycobacterium sp. MAA66 TaxID=3156297 RepID=UPI003517C176
MTPDDIENPPVGSRPAARLHAISSALDQAMSSASNGLIVMAVARVASVDAFGTASLLFAAMAAALCVVRGAGGTPIMLAAGHGRAALRTEAGFAMTAAVVFALVVSAVVAISTSLTGMPVLGLVFAVAIPLVLGFDVLRYAAISAAHPHLALLWDSIWALGSATVFIITVIKQDSFSENGVLLIWTGLAGGSLLGLAIMSRLRPRFSGIGHWWRAGYASRIRYGTEAGVEQLTVIVVLSMASIAASTAAAAALRGASVLVSPIAILISALPLVVIPQSVRDGTSVVAVWGKLIRIGACLSAVVVILGGALCLLPDHIGVFILGDSWPLAHSVLPIILVEYVGVVWMSTSMSFLRFQGKSAQLLATRVSYATATVVLCTGIAFVTRSAQGVATGLAFTALSMGTVLVLLNRPKHGANASIPLHESVQPDSGMEPNSLPGL